MALVLAHRLDEALLKIRVIKKAEILQLVGHGVAGLLGHGVAAAVVIDKAAADDGLGHRLAAGAAHLMPGAVDIDGKIHAGGNRRSSGDIEPDRDPDN